MTVKAAVLAAGYSVPDKVFPDYFTAPDVEEQEKAAEARGDDIVYDYSDVKFEMPGQSEEDITEALRLMQSMGANLNLSVGEDDDDWEPTPAVPEDLVEPTEADREWL